MRYDSNQLSAVSLHKSGELIVAVNLGVTAVPEAVVNGGNAAHSTAFGVPAIIAHESVNLGVAIHFHHTSAAGALHNHFLHLFSQLIVKPVSYLTYGYNIAPCLLFVKHV